MLKQELAQKDMLLKLHENPAEYQCQHPKAEQVSVKWNDEGFEVNVIHGKGACQPQTVIWR